MLLDFPNGVRGGLKDRVRSAELYGNYVTVAR